MKSGWKISLAFNFGLAAILIFILVTRQRAQDTSAPAPIASADDTVTQVVSASVPAALPTESQPFRWSQLESTNDYRDYVENLRAAACPEPTVEDIVWGDAERVFSSERQQLKLTGDEPGPWSKQREAQLVAYFLGQQLPPDTGSKGPSQPVASNQRSATPTYPLAFRDVDLDHLGLTDAQKQGVQQAIAGLRQQFIDQIGGINQDPSDPDYLARWQKAQPKIDAALRGWLGSKTFMAYQLAAQAKTSTTP